jgi:hypothetical protein
MVLCSQALLKQLHFNLMALAFLTRLTVSKFVDLSELAAEPYCTVETPPSNSNEEGTGLIGLGPYSASTIYDILKQDPSGYPPLERIFRQDPSTPNYITVLLGRSDDPDEMFPGDLTVSELIPGYENVTNQPKLPSINNGHWSTFLDGISVNGQIIELPKSQVANSGKQLTVVVRPNILSFWSDAL